MTKKKVSKPDKATQLAILEQEQLQSFQKDLAAVLDKHGFDLQVRQTIVPVRRQK